MHQPLFQPVMPAETRELSRARGWVDDVLRGDAISFEEIATREGLVERHVRFLIPLAFVAPKVIEAIADGAAPADLTVTPSPKICRSGGPIRSPGFSAAETSLRQEGRVKQSANSMLLLYMRLQ